MSMTKIHIWHDTSGKIVAVGRAVGTAQDLPMASGEHAVLEIEVEESDILSLHQTHAVDPLQKDIVEIKAL